MDPLHPLWALAASTLDRLLPPQSTGIRELLLKTARLVSFDPDEKVNLEGVTAPLGLVLTGRLLARFRVIRPGMPFGEEPFLGREPHDTQFTSPSGATALLWDVPAIEAALQAHPLAVLGWLRNLSSRHRGSRPPVWALGEGSGPLIERLVEAGQQVIGSDRAPDLSPGVVADLEQRHGQVFLNAQGGSSDWQSLCRNLADAELSLKLRGGRLHPRGHPVIHGLTPGLPGVLDPGNHQDWQRLADLVSGKARGLVLSGGGARGFAHIGVLRALEERHLSPDSLGGTSMGALVAAAYAADRDVDRLNDLARSLGKTSRVLDWSLGATSLTTGSRVARILDDLFGDSCIEDLASPFFCVASDLTRAKEVVFTTGRLSQAVRASLAIPGVFYPMVRRGDILVDGGLMNNLPLDVLARRLPGGDLTACDVTTGDWLAPAGWVGAHRAARGPWHQWADQLLPRRDGKVPGLANLLLQSLEVNSRRHYRESAHVPHRLLAIDVNGFDPLDFGKWKLLIDEGYRQASTQLATI